MKKRILVIFVFITCIFIFVSCTDSFSTPQTVYVIGREYTFGDTLKLKAENDVENEQFIITYTSICEDENEYYFHFHFHIYSTFDSFENEDFFEYNDNRDSEIIFNENSHYEFIGDRIFYVSYANAPEEIKTAIANNDYNFDFYCYTFTPEIALR